ncbi:cytochrome oxidase small assembly protein [Massilia sp. Mn16-1_5]|nr:cytochrome oxidase small assembly protein [Massilia sp. Mn16-1_5]
MNAKKKSNAKTALVLVAIAAFFFAAVILKRVWM